MKYKFFISVLFLMAISFVYGQKVVSRKQFFTDTAVLQATLTTSYKALMNQKKNPVFQPAVLTFHNLDEDGEIKAPLQVKLRGNFRRMNCSFASITFDFKDKDKKSRVSNLKQLKVVVPCEWGTDDEQWVIKEYLVYKMFQMFTDKSFRVRLLRFNFDDNSDSIKPYKQYGFILEDVDDLAKRVDSKEVGDEKIGSEDTDRMHATLVSIFQYMISNSDWKVPVRHNIKMIRPKDSAEAKPYVIPYDFDYSGAVNALYAEPAPYLGIEKVTDRLYLGFPRTIEEINSILKLFLQKEEEVINMISSFPLLRKRGKEEMLPFIQDFYATIKDQAKVKKIFVDNAITKWP